MPKTSKILIIGSIILAFILLANILTPHRGKDKGYDEYRSSLLTTGSNVVVTENSGNLYALVERLSLKTPLTGDVYGLATTFSVTDRLVGDIGLIAETLEVQRPVNGDIRMIGTVANIEQNVTGEILFLGSVLNIGESAVVRGDVHANVGDLIIDGAVQGDVSVSGDRLVISGVVGGNVHATRVKNIVLTEGALVRGSLTYKDSPRTSFVLEDGASVAGGVISPAKRKSPSLMHHRLGSIVEMLISLIASSFLMYGLFLRRNTTAAKLPIKKVLLRSVIGVGSGIVGLVLVLALAMTPGFGFISITLLLSLLLVAIVSIFASPILLGVLVQRLLKSKEGVTIKTVVTGIAVTLILVSLLKPLAFILFLILGTAFFGHLVRRSFDTMMR